MKILVPVDLYDSSHSAYEYALQFANDVNANITLLHIINSVFNTNDVIAYDPYDEMEATAKKRLKDFVSKYSSDDSYPEVYTKIEVMFGIPGFAISEYAKSNEQDMIIMGVRDKHGIFDRILGSASSETLKESKCPVMLIHNDTIYKKPEKILFAFDKKTDLDDALENYKEINNILHAKTDFLHINVKQTDDISKQKAEIVSELFEKDDPRFAFEIKTLSGNNVLTSLNDYCFFEKIDMISMIHRNEGIFSNFLQSDKSIQIAQKFQLPVIVFQED